ncbi:MAG: hypothetical protein DYG89_19225 [Caldilinea sp. CFX5]|nr:hypothetical protein [Caldilinea sp. CFX5]
MKQNRFYPHRIGAIVAMGLLWLLVACVPVIQPPAEDSRQSAAPPAESPAVQAARANLAQERQVDAAAITVVRVEAMEWPDACLGAPTAEEMCGQVIIPGYLITLAVDGTEYRYHTNEDGSMVRQPTAAGDMGVAPGSGDMGSGEMTFFVESIEVRILESNPVQVQAVVRGQLADACTTIAGATVEAQDQTFVITLQTTRPADQMCAQVLTPFEEVVPLGTPDPATGTYEVQVGDVVQSFTLGE